MGRRLARGRHLGNVGLLRCRLGGGRSGIGGEGGIEMVWPADLGDRVVAVRIVRNIIYRNDDKGKDLQVSFCCH